jgi:hypothetical protein
VKTISKRVLVLLLSIGVFILSVFGCYAIKSSGFSVKVSNVKFVSDAGASFAGTLYVPKNATAKTPAAAVLCCPGGNTPGDFYVSYAMELARRGYVTFVYDYYGVGKSDYNTAKDSGALAAIKYLTSFEYVDINRIGAIGHSNGGGQATTAITSKYVANAKNKSVLYIGCGVSIPKTYNNVNVGCIWATYDEAGQGRGWDTYHKNNMNLSSFADLLGMKSNEISVEKWYGDANKSGGRIIYTPSTFHSLSNIVPSSVQHIMSFMDTTLNGNVNGLGNSNFIYLWNELFTLLAALALCIMIFPIGSLLLDTKLFSVLKRPVPEVTSKGNAMFWVFLLIPLLCMALLVKPAVMQGQNILGKLPNIFKVQSTNGFVWWFFYAALISIGFIVIRMFVDKSFDKKAALARLKVSPNQLILSVIFGIVTVGVPYGFAIVGERLFGNYARIFQTYFSSMTPTRFMLFPVYFVIFALLFSVFTFIQADTLRLKDGEPWMNYVITWIANALPAILFLMYIFGTLIFTHITPINGREMSRANGVMLGMLILYFVIAKVVTYFYKKSGNIYVCAMVNAAFVVWLSVNVPQLIA